MNFENKVLAGECIETMKKLPPESFDFCFADPPYFLQIAKNKTLYRVEGSKFAGCDDDWDKFDSMEQYKKFTRGWLSEVKRLLKKDASICVISGMQSIFEIGNILRELGFWVINDIIWKKTNPTPNFSGSRLNNSHETIIWASKSKKSRFTFNYKTGKFMNNNKQMGSVWEFPVCSGKERLKDKNNKKLHTTQKPESLLYRIVTLFTKPNDLILDPFGGTMTTAVVAKKSGRNFTMIERDRKYISFGINRIKSTKTSIGKIERAELDKKPIKVSMAEMISNGYLKLGENFYHENGKKAKLADKTGKLNYNGVIKSMHEIAAEMMGRQRRVNAFDYLFVNRNGKLMSIDEIRNDYRRQLIRSQMTN